MMKDRQKDVTTSSRKLVRRKSGKVLRRVTVYLAPDLALWLRLFCAEMEAAMSDVVSDAIRRHLETSGRPAM